MKNFIVKGVFIFLSLIIVDNLFGIIIEPYFRDLPEKSNTFCLWEKCLFKKETDILILGASNASHHYIPSIIHDSLGMEIFVAATDGRDMIYSDIFLQSFLERRKPRCVILDVSTDRAFNGVWVNRMKQIKMYYNKNKYVTDYFDNETDFTLRLKLLSNLYRYNDTFNSEVMMGLGEIRTDYDLINGYCSLNSKLQTIDKKYYHGFSLDSVEYRHFNNICMRCKDVGIPLFLIESPHADYNIDFRKWLDSYVQMMNLSYHKECDNDVYYKTPYFFYDRDHLGNNGAKVFSSNIASFIKRSIVHI